MSSQRLGRGLRALIPEVEAVSKGSAVEEIAVAAIVPNPFQPRQSFDQEKLEELACSIAEYGLLEPVIVRPEGGRYQLVAGERRVRAAKLAGLESVPALVRSFEDLAMIKVALIENLQREDLNPIEEAEGYQRLMGEFALTQAEVATSVGKKRSSVANALRLLNLGEGIRQLVCDGELSVGHAKVLLSVERVQRREQLAARVIKEGLSVRQLEELVQKPVGRVRRSFSKRSPELVELEEDLQRKFGTKVSVAYKEGAGRISIEYYSDEELERLLELIAEI